ncbi:hypothetical protein HDU87_003666 [Geranomyces variabilis]|uniref:Uncharacterized protein n=1 Tax=Geranomyces variabilis TaxID=109894 RepID=A0AAD5TK13_9FUNG|nr:hypothetical protein HDU87_003666 [Geranomyces variabilis]
MPKDITKDWDKAKAYVCARLVNSSPFSVVAFAKWYGLDDKTDCEHHLRQLLDDVRLSMLPRVKKNRRCRVLAAINKLLASNFEENAAWKKYWKQRELIEFLKNLGVDQNKAVGKLVSAEVVSECTLLTAEVVSDGALQGQLNEVDDDDNDDSDGEGDVSKTNEESTIITDGNDGSGRSDVPSQGGRGPTLPEPECRWVLRTGKDVERAVNEARATIPEKQKASSLLHLGIIDVTRRDPLLSFTDDEWQEVCNDFRSVVQLKRIDEDLSHSVTEIMDSVAAVIEQADKHNVVDELEKLAFDSPRQNAIRRSVQQYAANVIWLKPIASEAVMDNATTAHLVRTLIDPMQKRWRLEECELQSIGSKLAREHDAEWSGRAASGQKLDMRVTLADTNEQLEALVCLRSGGLPVPSKKKIEGDRQDLLNCLMEILLSYVRKVSGVPADKLMDMFVLGLQSYDWETCIYGLGWRAKGVFCCGVIKSFSLPRSLPDIPLIENGVFTLLCVEKTLDQLVRMAKKISLQKAQLYSRERRVTLDIKSPYAATPPAKCKSAAHRQRKDAK